MNHLETQRAKPKQQLTFLDATSIIVGIVIGAGIYETTPLVASSVSNSFWLIILWCLGGLLSLIGALCYAELTTIYPKEGGDYVFLTEAYGRRMGFLFAWAGFWMVKPANIAAIAFIFARYAGQLQPQTDNNYSIAFAIAAVILLTLINITGVQSGKWTQNILTIIKVFGLLMVTIIGLFFVVPVEPLVTNNQSHPEHNFHLAMILVLFTYGGWSNISYVAAEIIRPNKNILRSLIYGTSLITLIYILVNLAFLNALGINGMRETSSIATETVSVLMGNTGAILISVLICITCLGNINGMIFTNSRVYYAMGQEHRLYRILGTWDKQLDAPVWSLTFQAIITLVLIILIGANENAFERLVIFSAPLHWFFFLMVGITLFKFRSKNINAQNNFKVPLYPWIPILFCLSTCFMFYASMTYAIEQRHPEAYWIIVIMGLGILASFYDPKIHDK